MRGRKQFAECAEVYSKGIDTIAKAEKSNWVIYYFRGICYERSKQWPKAEADLKKALELFPDQPHVLNYLGYSWIDQGVNLDEGMRMIKRAVEQRADDGYIVDSLGWAYYRIGNYEEAVKHLERAVELKPEDPTINDHLGDAYWRVGRTLEARFQWSHARDLKPEPEELAKIEEKLKSGLPDDPSSAADAEKAKKPRRRLSVCGSAVPRRARRTGARQGQPDAARRRPARRRLSRHRKPGRVRRRRRPPELRARPRACACGARADRGGGGRRRRQSRAQGGARARRARRRASSSAASRSTKRLPVAAGLGGGSADAAAALRLLARANRLALDDPRLIEAARATGADVPVCLDPRPRVMRGIGDILSEPLDLPRLPAVLVNPRRRGADQGRVRGARLRHPRLRRRRRRSATAPRTARRSPHRGPPRTGEGAHRARRGAGGRPQRSRSAGDRACSR